MHNTLRDILDIIPSSLFFQKSFASTPTPYQQLAHSTTLQKKKTPPFHLLQRGKKARGQGRRNSTHKSANVISPLILAFNSNSISKFSSNLNFNPSCFIISSLCPPPSSFVFVVVPCFDPGFPPRIGISPRCARAFVTGPGVEDSSSFSSSSALGMRWRDCGVAPGFALGEEELSS